MKRRSAAPAARRGLGLRIADGVARVTLARPESGNRVDATLAQALCDAAAEIELDDRVALVVIDALGASFCLGVENGGEWEQSIDWVGAVGRLTRPVVAAVQGDAVGEGLELALACDLRVVSQRARLALPQVAGGRMPANGATQRLPRLVGRGRAMDLLLTGRAVTADEAFTMGLASRLASGREFQRTLDAVVAELRAKAPIALRCAKEAVHAGVDLSLQQGIRLEQDLYVLLQTTADRREGVEAFLQRRTPTFHGK